MAQDVGTIEGMNKQGCVEFTVFTVPALVHKILCLESTNNDNITTDPKDWDLLD